MEFIDIKSLNKRLEDIKTRYQSQKPFKYVMFENFFTPKKAELIQMKYPITGIQNF